MSSSDSRDAPHARGLTIVLALVSSIGLYACAGSSGPGPLQANDWPKSEGRFRAELLVTDRHEELEQNWIGVINRGSYPTISTVDRVRKGQKVHVILLFANCIEVRDDVCRMTVEYSVTRPDGREYGSIADRGLWSGEPPARDLVFLGGPYMSFEADPVDSEGEYRITAVVRGAEGAISVAVTRTLVVIREPN